jgi:hypothetical protein
MSKKRKGIFRLSGGRKNNKWTLRFRFMFREGKEFPPATREKFESAVSNFIAQIFNYCASRGVAFPDDLELNFPDGSCQKFSGSKDKPLTSAEKEILCEAGRPIFLDFLESIARNEMERASIVKAKQTYEKMLFGRSEKTRTAFEFLRRWQNAKKYYAENPGRALSLIAPMWMVYLTPLLNALNALDSEFFERLAKAMRRSHSYREKLKKRLIETDELIHPIGRVQTWKEIGKKYCPRELDDPPNLQKLFKECGIRFEKVGEFRRKRLERVWNRKKNTR